MQPARKEEEVVSESFMIQMSEATSSGLPRGLDSVEHNVNFPGF